jgi:hypothetical protein
MKGRSTHTDLNQVVSFEELLMSHVIQQEALTRLLLEKGILTREEFWGMMERGACEDYSE